MQTQQRLTSFPIRTSTVLLAIALAASVSFTAGYEIRALGAIDTGVASASAGYSGQFVQQAASHAASERTESSIGYTFRDQAVQHATSERADASATSSSFWSDVVRHSAMERAENGR
jgi:hypothetical protein